MPSPRARAGARAGGRDLGQPERLGGPARVAGLRALRWALPASRHVLGSDIAGRGGRRRGGRHRDSRSATRCTETSWPCSAASRSTRWRPRRRSRSSPTGSRSQRPRRCRRREPSPRRRWRGRAPATGCSSTAAAEARGCSRSSWQRAPVCTSPGSTTPRSSTSCARSARSEVIDYRVRGLHPDRAVRPHRRPRRSALGLRLPPGARRGGPLPDRRRHRAGAAAGRHDRRAPGQADRRATRGAGGAAGSRELHDARAAGAVGRRAHPHRSRLRPGRGPGSALVCRRRSRPRQGRRADRSGGRCASVVPTSPGRLDAASLCSSMEEQFRPKETVGGSSPSRGTVCFLPLTRDFFCGQTTEIAFLPAFCPHSECSVGAKTGSSRACDRRLRTPKSSISGDSASSKN